MVIMNYSAKLYKVLLELYKRQGLENSFVDDNSYLKTVFVETNILWKQNFNQLTNIKLVIIGEAPLWGDKKNYIYNPDTHNTQFFTRNDLGKELGITIKNKVEFIEQCIEIGLVFIDTLPFALNQNITKLNFQKMSEYDYRYLFEKTASDFFQKKLNDLLTKSTKQTKVAFRYSRTKNYIGDLIESQLKQNNILQLTNMPIISLSKQGGLINRATLSKFLTE